MNASLLTGDDGARALVELGLRPEDAKALRVDEIARNLIRIHACVDDRGGSSTCVVDVGERGHGSVGLLVQHQRDLDSAVGDSAVNKANVEIQVEGLESNAVADTLRDGGAAGDASSADQHRTRHAGAEPVLPLVGTVVRASDGRPSSEGLLLRAHDTIAVRSCGGVLHQTASSIVQGRRATLLGPHLLGTGGRATASSGRGTGTPLRTGLVRHGTEKVKGRKDKLYYFF